MRKKFILLLILLVLLSGCRQLSDGEVSNFTERHDLFIEKVDMKGTLFNKPIKVLGLGDSLTEGVGDERQLGGYFGRLTVAMEDWEGVSEVKAVNAAKKGRRSDQLLDQLDNQAVLAEIKDSHVILMTIGGNDVMRIIKRDLFKLEAEPFYKELTQYEERLKQIIGKIRSINEEAVIIVGGLYNPFRIVAEEITELDAIIASWNEVIERQTASDNRSCYVEVNDLFHSNDQLVYHTDFFHPNAKGYEQMVERYLDALHECDLKTLTDGNFDM